MKFFLDTEFIERGHSSPIQLVSIGIVSSLDKEFYAVSAEFDPSTANDWVKQNVLPHVGDGPRLTHPDLAVELRRFIEANGLRSSDGSASKPEFWGYYADYDWVAFAQIFGTMMDLPKGWPKYCCDLKQWCDQLGNPKLPPQDSTEHNALYDARWNRTVYDFLAELAGRD
jgi:3'-5' exoribonuclease-like protein